MRKVRNYRFDKGANSARNFFILESDLRNIVKDREKSVEQNDGIIQGEITLEGVIREFVSDLEHIDDENYEVKVEEINIYGTISRKFINDAKKYFYDRIKDLEKNRKEEKRKDKNNLSKQETEQMWEEIEEFIRKNKDLTLTNVLLQIKEKNIFPEINSKQRKAIVKKIEKLIEEGAKKEEERKSKIEKTWKDICAIVDRECPKGDLTERAYLKNVIEYWRAIRDKIVATKEEQEDGFILSDSIQGDIVNLIDGKINPTEELLYYKEVKYFTKNFSFLSRNLETEEGVKGKTGRKFIDRKSYDRFYELRALLQKGYDEYDQISKILESDEIDETSKKILNERKNVLDKERKMKNTNSLGNYEER